MKFKLLLAAMMGSGVVAVSAAASAVCPVESFQPQDPQQRQQTRTELMLQRFREQAYQN